MNKGDVLDNMASFVNHMLRTKTLSCVCVCVGGSSFPLQLSRERIAL